MLLGERPLMLPALLGLERTVGGLRFTCTCAGRGQLGGAGDLRFVDLDDRAAIRKSPRRRYVFEVGRPRLVPMRVAVPAFRPGLGPPPGLGQRDRVAAVCVACLQQGCATNAAGGLCEPERRFVVDRRGGLQPGEFAGAVDEKPAVGDVKGLDEVDDLPDRSAPAL